MTEKNFGVSISYTFETLDQATKYAASRAVRNGDEIKVWQAVKLVAPKTPEVDITDIK